ncbi:hypothetical protein [Proteiniphilum sp. X52]|uniref:hypothetical protein n=1 Tax=Proteiniphilum sp. X52 TaxID=2382159 RepID=UPI000F0A1FFF|nr:hypothetical protein [Proteiniphilum sp. X52]RNC66468.1 hypothetical protein D7D25_03030 [Proteiniphilum sp. X52]
MEITVDFLKKAIQTKHPNYKKTVEEAKELRMHYDGVMPEDIIEKRRPNEPDGVKKYRKDIYVPITQNPISKVFTSLGKIRRSKDWIIDYNTVVPAGVREGESLEDYCEKNYPGFTSLTNWAFSELLSEYLLDANCMIAVVLKKKQELETEYETPVVEIFRSENVTDFVEGEYVVLKSRDVVPYSTTAGRYTYSDGEIYYVITPDRIVRFEQESKGKQFAITVDYEHGIGEIPAFKAGGIFKERVNNDTVYKSRISAMLPHLKEASREYSDLQAEIVQHIHSEKYYYTTTDCKHCNGSGKIGVDGACKECNGTGLKHAVSPYGQYLVKQTEAGNPIPQPPIGYVQKDTSIAKLQDERVDKHIYKALQSINMEFLAETPLNQSGLAKEVDKDELNNFVNSIAEDVVRILDNVYKYICEYRYRISVPNNDDRKEMLPTISVPERFDLLGADYLVAELEKAKTANVHPIVIQNMEIEYLRKRYNANQEIADELEVVYDIDPLPATKEEDKLIMLNNGGISQLDYIVSCNVVRLVRKALLENEDFYSWDKNKKRETVYKFAEDILKETSAKGNVMTNFERD